MYNGILYYKFYALQENVLLFWIFSVCAPPPPPSLVGAYYLQPQDARATFLHNDLLGNDTCFITGVHNVLGEGGHKRKRSSFSYNALYNNLNFTWGSQKHFRLW